MVVYPQIQEALILTIRMTDNEVASATHLHYELNARNWGIHVPADTHRDSSAHGENWIV
jgi:hypothetical protein